MENKPPELEVAIKAAYAAGEILEKYFELDIEKEIKEDTSITTVADKEAEEVIKKIILAAFPTHSILAEETGLTQNDAEYLWHVDPLDATRNFSNGIPFYAVSIALEHKGGLIVAVVYNPTTHALFHAARGRGAYLNNKKIHVSKDTSVRCMVTATSGKNLDDVKLRRALMHDLPGNIVSSVRDFGCSALDLSYVARGGLEAAIQLGLKTYDFIAGILLVQEAGGTITALDGSPWHIGIDRFIASNGVFHDKLVEEVKRQKEILHLS